MTHIEGFVVAVPPARKETDPRMHDLGGMPFDGRRMIFGGFVPILDVRNGSCASTAEAMGERR
jgi:uncharacterized protein YbaA (DUF1428 family)